jgi:cytochrome c oxidase assembly factor CtaG
MTAAVAPSGQLAVQWFIEPGSLLWIVVAEVLWLRAWRILRGRGVRVAGWQVAAWHGGIGLWTAGLLSPLHAYGEDLLSAHMVQHLLIADIAAPLLLIGLRSPLLVFFLPREVLVPLARSRLRPLLRALRRPLVAIPVYVAVLYGWHFGFMFEAAVRSPLVHAVQHATFIGAGVLVWWSALEPKRRRTPGALWKIGHILGARLAGMFLGMSFVLIREPVYTSVYGSGERGWGLQALGDQQLAGGLMVVVDILIMVFALCFFFLRAGQEHDRDEAAATGTGRAGQAHERDEAGATGAGRATPPPPPPRARLERP